MALEYLKKAVPQTAADIKKLQDTVAALIQEVRDGGDEAVRAMTKRFDGIELGDFRVTEDEFLAAEKALPRTLKEDMDFAMNQVRSFAQAQRDTLHNLDVEVGEGIHLGHRIVPVSSAGAYVPGGRYPIIASCQMLVCPASVAGVKRIAAVTPPQKSGSLHPATLYALKSCGATEVYKVGGVQAIAALAYGTETIKPVDKIVGPGNKYVAEAKRQVNGVVGLDLQAGPSEILILADETAHADVLAADLLGQLEHDPNAKGCLCTTSKELGLETIKEVEKQLVHLATRDVAGVSWVGQGEVVVVDSMDEACDFANEWAPEHLQVHCKYPKVMLNKLYNYGSIFLGERAAEVYGDKVSGTNHTLPTGKAARYTGGVWVGTYLKWITHQWVTEDAMKKLGYACYRNCMAEGMVAHALAAAIRLEKSGEPVTYFTDAQK